MKIKEIEIGIGGAVLIEEKLEVVRLKVNEIIKFLNHNHKVIKQLNNGKNKK